MLVLFLVMVYLTFPETKGLTLEELADLFEDGNHTAIVEKVEGIEPEVERVDVEMDKKD